jgi:DNA polymerase III delta prime subunit
LLSESPGRFCPVQFYYGEVMSDLNALVFAEYYRPKTVDECILPENTKKMIKDAISSGNIPHLVLAGTAGIGKTSLARAICNEINADLLYINASLETSIDVIRTKVVGFSSAVSFDGSMKVILMDELEGMSSSAMNSLKAVIEEFPNVRYIFTTNNPAKIIDPIKSRCVVIDFKIDSKERPKLAAQMFKRVMGILKEREIEFDQKVVAEVVNKFFPDFRRTLNEIQRHSASGKIDSGILVNTSKTSYKELVKTLAAKDFKAMRQWVGENSDMDPATLFRDFYDNCYEYFEPSTIPNVILLLSDYQFKAIHSVDQSINLAAFLIEVMMSAKFKDV